MKRSKKQKKQSRSSNKTGSGRVITRFDAYISDLGKELIRERKKRLKSKK